MNKYRNTKTQAYGMTFDSKAEARRYGELLMLENIDVIRMLCRQVPYELAPSVRLHGEKRKRPAVRYIADFQYYDVAGGRVIVEDTKGIDTPVSRLKRHLMATVRGIEVRLTR